MKKALGLAGLALVAIGCGGAGDGFQSAFQGHFAGNWVHEDITPGPPPPKGTMDIVIDSKGKVTGTFTELNPNRNGTLTGKVNRLGELTFAVAFQPDTVDYTGHVTLTPTKLTGTFGEKDAGYIFFPAFILDRQP